MNGNTILKSEFVMSEELREAILTEIELFEGNVPELSEIVGPKVGNWVLIVGICEGGLFGWSVGDKLCGGVDGSQDGELLGTVVASIVGLNEG